MADKTGAIWQYEVGQLARYVDEVQKNIEIWIEKKKDIDKRTKELYDHYHSDNPELISDLMLSLDRQDEAGKTLRRNMRAKAKPYFGRIDFIEAGAQKDYTLYIGKSGIAREDNSTLITDWRAPVSGVYYEGNLGDTAYEAPAGRVGVDLKLKRTYEIEDSSLLDYYDTDVIANDEFLTKYLSKNKEVVLGEIIATIQKEQDEIIRDKPWHSVIVQGVAGSGKTTVAMHRISYILYNYKEDFKPNEFYIIGSNRMLLNYITGVLPDLDVYNANQKTMEELFISLLDTEYSVRKNEVIPVGTDASFKGGIKYVLALEKFLNELELNILTREPAVYDGKVLMTSEDIYAYLSGCRDKSVREKAEQLNDRFIFLLRNHLEYSFYGPEYVKEELKKFKNYFVSRLKKPKPLDVYASFVMSLSHAADLNGFGRDDLNALMQQLSKNKHDVYDLCMLLFIHNRLFRTAGIEKIKHMVIDEAQDFGVSIFYVLRKILKNCTFTIMGDISQNINYYTGMNDWSAIRNQVFSPERDRFYILAKSYRNTVEISEFAGNILKKCSFETYGIEPVIRHGKPVETAKAESEADMISKTVQALKEIDSEGYTTVAVICRNDDEAEKVCAKLSKCTEVTTYDKENPSFSKGVMVLPINLTKGLEFDAVILFDPTAEKYPETDADAKLLYVAVTRALHELRIIYKGEISGLLV